LGDGKGIQPINNLAAGIPKDSSLEDMWGPGLTWTNLQKNMMVKKPKVVGLLACP